MKRTLFLTAALISLASSVKAAPCTVFITTQDTAAANELIIDKAYTTSGVDFSSATTIKAQAGQVLVDNATPINDTFKIESADGWTALTNTSYSADINVQVTGETVRNIFGAMGSAKAGQLTLEIAAGSSIGSASYDGKTAAIAGSHGGGGAEAFNVYVEGGTVWDDIVGGAIYGKGHIDSVKIVVNGGDVKGKIYGGSKTDGSVDNAHIIIAGGIITDGINAGGNR